MPTEKQAPVGEITNPKRSTILTPWIVLAALALFLACLQNAFVGYLANFIPHGSVQPGAMRLSLGLMKLLYCLPIAPLIVGALALKWRWLRRQVAFSVGNVCVCLAHVLICSALMASFAFLYSGGIARRFPSGVREVIESADRVELLSLLPDASKKKESGIPTIASFHGYPLLGRTPIIDPIKRKELIEKFLTSVDIAHEWPGMCFWPRHALVCEYGDKKVEILICYQCGRSEVYCDGERSEMDIGINIFSKEMLNQMLREANVSLAPESPN